MSENKYIIDKDSLTGIADAVRNKLGNGKAITDEDAGYYPQEAIVGKFSTPSHKESSAVTWTTCYISSQNYSLYFDKPFYQISVTGTFVVGTTFKLHANNWEKNCAGGNRTYIWTWTNPQTQLTLLSQSYGSATINSYPNGYSSELTIVFKDQDGNALIPKTSSIQYVSGSTTNFLLGQAYFPVPFSIDDIQDKITNYLGKSSSLIAHEGLSYGYVALDNVFYSNNVKNYFLTFIPLSTGQKIGFCIGETVSNRLRALFFSGKTYNNFSQYVENSFSNSQIYSNGISITGSTELSGDGLLKRFYYTAPSDGMLVVGTSNESKLAFLHVWEA